MMMANGKPWKISTAQKIDQEMKLRGSGNGLEVHVLAT